MNRRGFTLLEVLVGLMILAILVTLVQGVYSAVSRNKKASSETTMFSHGAASLSHRMADELSMAFLNLKRVDQTKFVLDTDMDENSTVEFTTRTPRVETMREGGDTRVRYELEKDEESEGLFRIVRSEMADPFGEIERDGSAFTMLDRIKSFTVEAYDGSDWTKTWFTDPNAPKVPFAVRLTIVWADKGDVKKTITCASSVYSAR